MKRNVIAFAILAGLATATAAQQQRIGDFDFAYEIRGESKVRPLQVFDNGSSTFFQFRSGEPIPLILSSPSSGSVRLTPSFDGPYVRVSGVGREFTLKMGLATGHVTYQGNRSDQPAAKAAPAETTQFAQVVLPGDASSQPRYTPTSNPGVVRRDIQDEVLPRIAVDVNSYAVPLKGDVAQFQPLGVQPTVAVSPAHSPGGHTVTVPFVIGAERLGPRGRSAAQQVAKAYRAGQVFTITGQHDVSFKEGLGQGRVNSIRNVLIQHGVPATVIRTSVSESIATNESAGVVTGASLTVHGTGGSSNGYQQQAFVSVADVQASSLQALEAQLRAKKITPAQAAQQIAAVRGQTAGVHVQPLAGWQEAQITNWQLRATDFTVQGALQRWASEAGWTLIWKNGPDIKVLGDSQPFVRDGFMSAADYVLAQARSLGHHVKGRAYRNRVLVVSAE